MRILTDVDKEACFCDIENRLCSVGIAYQYELSIDIGFRFSFATLVSIHDKMLADVCYRTVYYSVYNTFIVFIQTINMISKSKF
jgi:hypothetical protein